MSLKRSFTLRTDADAKAFYAVLRGNWRQMAEAGNPICVTLSEAKAKRSLEQNALYWRWLSQVAEEGWWQGKRYTAEQWHGEFGYCFLPKIELPSGQMLPVSTTTLSVEQFTTYLDEVGKWVADNLGIVLV